MSLHMRPTVTLIVFVFPYRRYHMTAHYERNWPYM